MLRAEVSSSEEDDRACRVDGIRFVFIDASIHYVDERGQHSGQLSASSDVEEERCRLRTVSNNERWLHAAVEVGNELIELARRSGDAAAWGCTSGNCGAGSLGPNRMIQVIKSVTGRRPPPPVQGPLARPVYGRWTVRQVFEYEIGKDAPAVAIWHLGFTQNPQFFPRWCEAISAGLGSPVLLLPDSPIMRDAVGQWSAGERYRASAGWHGDNVRDYLGSAAYVRPRVSAAIDIDGSDIRGEHLVAAIDFLRARHQLRVSPFDLLRDPLLLSQLRPVDVEDPAWTRQEKATLAFLDERYDVSQRMHAWLVAAHQTPPVDVFSTGDSYESSVESCLRTAERAITTGEVTPVLISSWTGWAPSAVARGERPDVPARTGSHGRLVDWYRRTFRLAADYGLIGAEWFSVREAWHAEAFETFPGTLNEYYGHIYAAERSLVSESERQRVSSDGDFRGWHLRVLQHAAALDLLVGAGIAEGET